jgi:hypothetical protein
MRKLILISAFVLASASVQAGESRSLVLAANDQPPAAASAQPAEVQPQATRADVKAEASKRETSKARRIAARYGVYW